MAVSVNQLLETMKFSDLQSFLRSRDNRQAIASYILDEAKTLTFFDRFPKLIYREYGIDSLVGDLVKINRYNLAIGGVGLPGNYKKTRQLAGSETIASAAFNQEVISLGMHRYAVAMESFFDKKLLPQQIVSIIFGSITKWWAERDDADTFATLFRDYTPIWAETSSLTSVERDIRVGSLIGRGVYNDIGSTPEVIFAGNGTKNDIEPGVGVTGFRSVSVGDRTGLSDTDTLTDVFIKDLERYARYTINMPTDISSGYSLIANRSDIHNLFENSNATLVSNLKSITSANKGSEVFKEHPIFTQMVDSLYNINFFQFEPADAADGNTTGITRPINSYKDRMRGTPINPQAQVLAVARRNGGVSDTVVGLNVWEGGDYSSDFNNRTHNEADGYYLYVSSGGDHFPYFDGVTVGLGKDSINSIDVGLYNGGTATNTYYGRLQVGQGNTPTTRWKIVYTGPVYVGTLQVGTNNQKVSFVENVYRLRIISLHRWDPQNGKFGNNTIATDWNTFKTFLGIDNSTNVINVTSAYQNRTYQVNRRVHMFDCVRSILFGRDLIYKITGTENDYAEEVRDYGAITGRALTVQIGKKVVTDAHGLVSNYAIVVFKRPPFLI